ncbi:copper resistance protein CopC [Streptomyces sp. NPDC093261]|uniref:copper resistance CopC family protein n=1 Tax=Streptomyces sp. NPDC093261 TaxID=3366037 RepID=UPI0037FF9BAA
MDGQADGRHTVWSMRLWGRAPVRGLALTGTLLVMLLFGGAGTASAHAVLTGSAPADGSVVKSAPKQVTLAFTESVGLLDNSFGILDPDNHEVHTGKPTHAAGHSDSAQVALPAKLAQGTYTVSWRVVSADSHPVSAVTREPQPVGAHRGDAGEAGSGGVGPAPLESFSGRESSAVDWPAPGQASCRRGLRRTVLAEVALAVAVMAITTVLTDIDEVTVTKTIKIA